MFCRLRLKFKLMMKKISTKNKNKKKTTTTQPKKKKNITKKKHTHTHKKKKHKKKIIKTHEKKYNPKNFNVEQLYKNGSHGIRTRANITGSMTEVLHVSIALFFRLIKHVKNKQLKLILDFTCKNIFTQQLGTTTAITLKFSNLFS